MSAIGRLLGLGLVIVLVGACSRAGGQPTAASTPTPTPTPSAVAGGGGSEPNPGSGVTAPPGGSGAPLPIAPVPTIVVPKPGRLDAHAVGATAIEARVDGRHVTVRLTWWSGVEPCSVLDSVAIETAGNQIRLMIREGSDRRDVACIEIAMLKATLVDLGELAPGSYTISAGGTAPPIRVVVG